MKPARSLAFAVTMLCAACTMGPDYHKPDVDLGMAYKENPGWKAATPADDLPRGAWWALFGDAELNALIARADAANQTLAQALAQYRQAQATVQSSASAAYPEVNFSGGVDRSRSKAKISNADSLRLGASWEPDLWGSVSRSVEAAEATAQASAATLANTRLSIETTLAEDYFLLRVTDEAIRLQSETVSLYQRSFAISQNQLKAGTVTRADVAQAQTQLSSAQAQLTDYQLTRVQYEHAIAILVGELPARFAIAPTAFSLRLPEVPYSVPSALLERRPDVAAAERRLAAASAQIGVAKAAWFPTLSLSASGGVQSSQIADLLSAPSRVWSIGAQLAGTVFDGGLRQARVDQAQASFDAALAAYRQAVLNALREVEDNLVALNLLGVEADQQAQAVAAADEAQRRSLNQYKAGTVNFTSVVTTQAAANSAQRAASQLVGRRYLASVELIKALGGGWQGLTNTGPAAGAGR